MGSNGGYDLRPQDHPFGDKDLRFDQFQAYSCGICHLGKSIVDTLVVFLFALLFELMDDVVFSVSCLLPVTVPVRSPFLDVVVKNRKEVHRVLDEFLIFLSSFTQEVLARAVDDADVPNMINILFTAFWVPCRVIRTGRCSQLHGIICFDS